MQILFRELVNDLAKYVLLADTQDIYITQDSQSQFYREGTCEIDEHQSR